MKLKGATSISGLSEDEVNLVNFLREKGIYGTMIFRRGLEAYEKEVAGQFLENNIDTKK